MIKSLMLCMVLCVNLEAKSIQNIQHSKKNKVKTSTKTQKKHPILQGFVINNKLIEYETITSTNNMHVIRHFIQKYPDAQFNKPYKNKDERSVDSIYKISADWLSIILALIHFGFSLHHGEAFTERYHSSSRIRHITVDAVHFVLFCLLLLKKQRYTFTPEVKRNKVLLHVTQKSTQHWLYGISAIALLGEILILTKYKHFFQ